MGRMERDTVASHGHYRIWKLESPYPEQKLKPNGLSVVTPTYNRRTHLERALDSIFAQENPVGLPMEILVVNDGSTDDTAELFKKPLRDKPDWIDVKYFETGVAEWTSPANSYNIGFKNAKYNYVVHSGADIIWYKPSMFSEIMAACDVDRYLIFNYYVLNEAQPKKTIKELLGFANRGRTTLYPWCVVTSAEATKRVGYYEDNFKPGAGEDDAMIMKFDTIGVKFCRVTNQLVINQEHKKQYVRDAKWKQNTRFNVSLGHRASAELRRKIQRGEIEKF